MANVHVSQRSVIICHRNYYRWKGLSMTKIRGHAIFVICLSCHLLEQNYPEHRWQTTLIKFELHFYVTQLCVGGLLQGKHKFISLMKMRNLCLEAKITVCIWTTRWLWWHKTSDWDIMNPGHRYLPLYCCRAYTVTRYKSICPDHFHWPWYVCLKPGGGGYTYIWAW